MTMHPINEEKMIGFLRNALVVAGQEMGEAGDHWPVINSTVHDIMKTWENVKIERDVDAEMKKHLYKQLEIMEQEISESGTEVRADIEPRLQKLRDLYDAYFSELDESAIYRDENEIPAYVKRAENIISTLGDEDV